VTTIVVDADGFIVTDKLSLRVKGVKSAFAVGDATDLPTAKSGVCAHLEAKVVASVLNGTAATLDGRTNCPLDLADGTGTFVIRSYTVPVMKNPPSRIKHLMKMMVARIYWLSLLGTFEPIFDWSFARTAPEKLAEYGT
jgi:sulfide:quinone oxidoreductase